MLDLIGRYYFKVSNPDGTTAYEGQARNLVVDGGLGRIADLLAGNVFGSNYYPCLHQIDTTGMVVTNSGFTSPQLAIDGDAETYTYAIPATSTWGSTWWKIDLGASKSIMALYWDACESDVSYGADYKFQYSLDDSTYYDFDVRMRPPQEDLVRGKVLFFVGVSPPFMPVSGVRYIRLNIKAPNSQSFRLHELKIYEQNFLSQPPCVMAVGTSDTAATVSDISLANGFAKVVSNITRPANNVTRFILDLGPTEANSANYWEVGMFFNASNNYSLQTTSNATTLFSRAVFDTVLTKSSGQTAQIVYEITINNAA